VSTTVPRPTVVATTATGPSGEPIRLTEITQTLPSGREYVLETPGDSGDSGEERPLVVALHGYPSTPARLATVTGLTNFAAANDFVVAYGMGVDQAWNAGGCCGDAQADDVAYLREVVDSAASLTPIDRSRVYVVGMSNGAMMAYRAICEAPDVFAAAGVVAGALLDGVDCEDTVVHVYSIHGADDTTVPLHGGVGYSGIDFPAQSSNLDRVGVGSVVVMHTWDGGHAYPGWATAELWRWLQQWAMSAE
jgi:poly(3-hydroxybutyrate) depolymerase